MKLSDAKKSDPTLYAVKRLSALIRAGKATPEQVAEYERANAEFVSRSSAPRPPARTIYDLPVAKALFRADARSMGW